MLLSSALVLPFAAAHAADTSSTTVPADSTIDVPADTAVVADPAADPAGAILGAAAVKVRTRGADNRSLSLKGLPAGYGLTEGDYLEITAGVPPRAELFRIVAASAAADGSGNTAEFEVRPHLRDDIAANATVNLRRPAAEMTAERDGTGSEATRLTGSVTLRLRQYLG